VTWPGAVLPAYDGFSIGNIPATLLNAFNIPAAGMNPVLLEPLSGNALDESLLDGSRVVILVVVDGLGARALEWARQRGAIRYLDAAHQISTITSVFPSTTVAALTSLQTGLSPAQHGMAGYTLYLEEQSATVNMITWKPAGGVRTCSALPDLHTFLGVPTIFNRLQKSGVESTIVSNLAYIDSPLTNVQSAGVPYRGHRTLSELAGLLLAEARKPGQRFIYGYWDGFDALAHSHGPESDICLNEISLIDQAIGRGLLEPLAGSGENVSVLVVADHGHTVIDGDRVLSLKAVLNRFSRDRPIPTGDRRATGLAFDGTEALAQLGSIVDGHGVIVSVADALAAGLYGPGSTGINLQSRVGKTLVLAKGTSAFVYPQSSNPTAGGHGSLTAEEMLVPLLAWRF
jgi:hypothetical protein